jgi:hypothetical protein
MLTLLATLEFLTLLWKLETVFQSIFVFPDSRFHGTSSSSSTTTTASVKQEKLCDSDKQAILRMFDSLNQSKMWKLSSGVVAEEKMRELALKCEYEQ